MRRLVAPVLAPFIVLTMLLAGSLAWAAPVGAAPHPTSRLPRAAGQEVGDTVALFSTDGDEEGSFTITDLTDDFEDTDEQPPRGERMVSLDVEIEADGGDFAVDPASFNLVDSTGVLWIDIPVERTDRKDSLEEIDLEDGDAVEGSLEIVIPSGVDISKLIYIVDNERVLTLLDFTSGVEAGDTVDLYTSDGEETGTIVADEVFEEFDDLEEGSEPARGGVVYGIVVTVENTGSEPLLVGPDAFLAVDELGTAWAADTTIDRTRASTREFPDLDSGELDEGDEVTGFVAFTVGADVPIDYVAYIPEARLYPVVDNVATSAVGDDDASPAADDDPLGPTGDDETPVAGEGDCTGVVEWSDSSTTIITEWGDAVGGLDAETATPDDYRDVAADVEAIVESQSELDVPAEAEELNDLLVDAYEDTVDALNDAADGVEEEDDALLLDAGNALTEIGERFQEGGDVFSAIEDLAAACPDDIEI